MTTLMPEIRGLYAITMNGSPTLIEDVTLALQGGAKVIQYRDKSADHPRRLQEASQLKQLCELHDCCFIINDDVQLALAIDADGVHIGREDGDVQAIKQRLGDKILGVSCYNSLFLAQQAVEAGADYVAFGRFFVSNTKPDAVQANMDLIRQAKEQFPVPVVAIGGIDANNASSLVEVGVDAVAVIGGIFQQENIQQCAQKISQLFSE